MDGTYGVTALNIQTYLGIGCLLLLAGVGVLYFFWSHHRNAACKRECEKRKQNNATIETKKPDPYNHVPSTMPYSDDTAIMKQQIEQLLQLNKDLQNRVSSIEADRRLEQHNTIKWQQRTADSISAQQLMLDMMATSSMKRNITDELNQNPWYYMSENSLLLIELRTTLQNKFLDRALLDFAAGLDKLFEMVFLLDTAKDRDLMHCIGSAVFLETPVFSESNGTISVPRVVDFYGNALVLSSTIAAITNRSLRSWTNLLHTLCENPFTSAEVVATVFADVSEKEYKWLQHTSLNSVHHQHTLIRLITEFIDYAATVFVPDTNAKLLYTQLNQLNSYLEDINHEVLWFWASLTRVAREKHLDGMYDEVQPFERWSRSKPTSVGGPRSERVDRVFTEDSGCAGGESPVQHQGSENMEIGSDCLPDGVSSMPHPISPAFPCRPAVSKHT